MTTRHAARTHHRRTPRDRYVTVPTVATLIGCARQTVYAMVARGELQGEHIAGRLVIVRASLSLEHQHALTRRDASA